MDGGGPAARLPGLFAFHRLFSVPTSDARVAAIEPGSIIRAEADHAGHVGAVRSR